MNSHRKNYPQKAQPRVHPKKPRVKALKTFDVPQTFFVGSQNLISSATSILFFGRSRRPYPYHTIKANTMLLVASSLKTVRELSSFGFHKGKFITNSKQAEELLNAFWKEYVASCHLMLVTERVYRGLSVWYLALP